MELVTEDDTPSSHGSTDTKSHHLLLPSPPPNPTQTADYIRTRKNLEDSTSPDKTHENMLSIDLFIIHILNTHPHPQGRKKTKQKKKQDKMEWNGRSLWIFHPPPHSLRKKKGYRKTERSLMTIKPLRSESSRRVSKQIPVLIITHIYKEAFAQPEF